VAAQTSAAALGARHVAAALKAIGISALRRRPRHRRGVTSAASLGARRNRSAALGIVSVARSGLGGIALGVGGAALIGALESHHGEALGWRRVAGINISITAAARRRGGVFLQLALAQRQRIARRIGIAAASSSSLGGGNVAARGISSRIKHRHQRGIDIGARHHRRRRRGIGINGAKWRHRLGVMARTSLIGALIFGVWRRQLRTATLMARRRIGAHRRRRHHKAYQRVALALGGSSAAWRNGAARHRLGIGVIGGGARGISGVWRQRRANGVSIIAHRVAAQQRERSASLARIGSIIGGRIGGIIAGGVGARAACFRLTASLASAWRARHGIISSAAAAAAHLIIGGGWRSARQRMSARLGGMAHLIGASALVAWPQRRSISKLSIMAAASGGARQRRRHHRRKLASNSSASSSRSAKLSAAEA